LIDGLHRLVQLHTSGTQADYIDLDEKLQVGMARLA